MSRTLFSYLIILGNQVATSGAAISSARTKTSIAMKGRADLITCPIVTLKGAIPFIT